MTRKHLPVSFRVNPAYPQHQKLLSFLNESESLREILESAGKSMNEEELRDFQIKHGSNLKNLQLDALSWFPGKLAYVLNLSRNGLKKCKDLKKLHKVLQIGADCGLITRQEAVSMIPPLLLDPKPDDLILDMCAAPGSKTTEILELISSQYNLGEGYKAKGGVVANDMDIKRAYMLTHQIKRLGTPGMAVINHEGQQIPTLTDINVPAGSYDRKLYFDKILVDVPCTGDGAIRKLPTKWRKWSTRDASGLHPVQLQLLKRALQLTRVGGTVVYSTCSINPIENEAIIAEIMRISTPGSIEIIDIHDKLQGFKGRRGLLNWDVLIKRNDIDIPENSKEEKNWDELFEHYPEFPSDPIKARELFLKKSMFPYDEETMKKNGVHHSMRVMPHDQDTGGFFICVIKKHGLVYFDEGNAQTTADEIQIPAQIPKIQSEEDQKIEEFKEEGESFKVEEVKAKKDNGKYLPKKFETLVPLISHAPEHWTTIKEYYGLDEVSFI